VLNKVDRVEDPLGLQLLVDGRDAEVVHTSAKSGEGIGRLTQLVAACLDARGNLVDVVVPLADGRSIAMARRAGAVLAEEIDEERELLRLRARCSPGALGVLRRQVGAGVRIEVVEGPRASGESS